MSFKMFWILSVILTALSIYLRWGSILSTIAIIMTLVAIYGRKMNRIRPLKSIIILEVLMLLFDILISFIQKTPIWFSVFMSLPLRLAQFGLIYLDDESYIYLTQEIVYKTEEEER